MYVARAELVLASTRRVLADAQGLIKGSLDTEEPASAGGTAVDRSVLSLYDELRLRLGSIDDVRIRGLLTSVAENIEELGRLSSEVERLRKFRRLLARSGP